MKKNALGFTLTAAIALAIASVSSAQEIVERIQVQAGEMPVQITTYAPVVEVESLVHKAILPIEHYGDSAAYVTWEQGGYVYRFVDNKASRVYAVSLNAGDRLDTLSKMVGVALRNPIMIPVIEYDAKGLSAVGKANIAVPVPVPTGWGRILAGYRGVDSYYNGPTTTYTNGDTVYGYKWQCVEFIGRFYSVVFGRDIRGVRGHALTYWTKAAGHNLRPYANGGTEPPKAGDVLVSTGNVFGHVAIATTVVLPTTTTAGYVDLIHQNWGSTATMRLTLKRIAPVTANGLVKYQLNGFGSSLPIAGWAR